MEKQPHSLLHVGRLRTELERIASETGDRWQDLARQVLSNFVHMKQLEHVTQQITFVAPSEPADSSER